MATYQASDPLDNQENRLIMSGSDNECRATLSDSDSESDDDSDQRPYRTVPPAARLAPIPSSFISCAWCRRALHPGVGHGVCASCSATLTAELDAADVTPPVILDVERAIEETARLRRVA